jgi:hypothetical protein
MNFVRNAYDTVRKELVTQISSELRSISEEIQRTSEEVSFATTHCPNRLVSIQAHLLELNRRKEYLLSNEPLHELERTSAPFLSKDVLTQPEIDTFFYKIGAIGTQQQSVFGGLSSSTTTATATTTISDSNSDPYMCLRCDEVRTRDEFQAFSICRKCGHAVPFHKEGGEATETLQYTMQFEYDRINHFRECLNQIIKAVENIPSIDRRVFRYVKRQILKERITEREKITRKRIKDWLKRDKTMNRHSERVFSILYHVCKVRPPKISKPLEQKFYEMFHEIQKPFGKHVPPGRTHFFNYSFILRKFSELLGQDQLVPVFDILKGIDRVHFQDEIWKRCCADKGWKFFPSV